MMRKVMVLLILVAFGSFSNATTLSPYPRWFNKAYSPISKSYRMSGFIKASPQHGDLNGDGREDIQIPIENQRGKKGILIAHQGSDSCHILRAGKSFGNGGDDWSWLSIWYIYKKKTAQETRFKNNGD